MHVSFHYQRSPELDWLVLEVSLSLAGVWHRCYMQKFRLKNDPLTAAYIHNTKVQINTYKTCHKGL